MSTQAPIIKVSQVTKAYRGQSQNALENISFDLKPQEKVGLIGANGSGKTTLFHLLLNLLHSTSGSIEIMNQKNLEKTKHHLGYVSEYQEGLENFTPYEILSFSGKMAGMSSEKISERLVQLFQQTGLDSHKNELISTFSKGMRQRLLLASALIHEPEILLLDEPMSGLDPKSQKDFLTLLQRLENFTIIYASHQLSEIEVICDRIIFFHEGKLIKDIYLNDLQEEIFVFDADPQIEEMVKNFSPVKIREITRLGDQIRVEIVANSEQFQELLILCKKEKIKLDRIKSKSMLVDLYNRYIKI
jgi:ABC-2 type transport system ATP-binding protein